MCTAWRKPRNLIFGSAFITHPRELAMTFATLGQPVDLALKRTIPYTFAKGAQHDNKLETEKRFGLLEGKVRKEQKTIQKDELQDWILRTALFLETIHYKRRKLLEALRNTTDTTPAPAPTTKQARITDFFSREVPS